MCEFAWRIDIQADGTFFQSREGGNPVPSSFTRNVKDSVNLEGAPSQPSVQILRTKSVTLDFFLWLIALNMSFQSYSKEEGPIFCL